jgi:hypothetical protein
MKANMSFPLFVLLFQRLVVSFFARSRTILFGDGLSWSGLVHARILLGEQVEQMAGLRRVQAHKDFALVVLDFESKAVFASRAKRQHFLPRIRLQDTSALVCGKEHDALRIQHGNSAGFGSGTNQLTTNEQTKNKTMTPSPPFSCRTFASW